MENSAAPPAAPTAPGAPGGPGGPIGPCGPGGPGGPGEPRRKSKSPPDFSRRSLADFSGGFCESGLVGAGCALKSIAQKARIRETQARNNSDRMKHLPILSILAISKG
ncbi:hypothetical protein F9K50_04200 [bacterium]|nr:MAG: hypothetical protein F9K50_04200 [bacterium]